MLILCDFDGTVTARDTNSFLSERFAPEVFATLEGKLASREVSLRELLSAELGAMTAGHEAIVAAAVEGIPMRPGFDRFLEGVERRGDELVLLSAGFRQLIEPLLRGWGIDRELELIANEVQFDETGGRITWRELATCELCSEQCKRADVANLRRRSAHTEVVYIGDGFSDRCGAETADLVFARDNLARYLDQIGRGYRWFDDFDEIDEALN